MSNPTIDKITNAEKSLKKMFKEAPFLVKQNGMFVGVTALSGELIEILKDQQNQIEALKEDQYSRSDF